MPYGIDDFCPHLNANGVGSNMIITNAIQSKHLSGQSVTMGTGTHGTYLGPLDAIYLSVQFATTGATAVATHAMSKSPKGWLVVDQDKGGDVFKYAAGTQLISFKAEGPAATDMLTKILVW